MPSMIRNSEWHEGVTRSCAKLALVLATLLVMGNLSALVDSFVHPEIPYFDHEHLVIGGITALVTQYS